MVHLAAPKLDPAREARRLDALHDYAILDTPREAVFEDITRIASLVCGTPIAVVNLIDADRQWFKAEVGLGVRETPLATSICAHAILEHDLLVVPDTTRDPRFAENPLVTGDPRLRFYAGALLKTTDGLPLGTVCVLDTTPRELSAAQTEILQRLARQVMAQLELRRMVATSDRERARMSGLIAAAGHDVKSPLRAALYAVDRAASASADDLPARLADAKGSLRQIDLQFTQLATVAALTAGVRHGEASTALSHVFGSMAAAWGSIASRKGLTFDVGPTDLHVVGQMPVVETLLGNLVSNAIKYTPRGGHVSVRAAVEGDRVRVTVEDTGLGIADEQIEGLFAPFHQLDPRAEGLGLGLWIVRQTAVALEADVNVTSHIGKGSRFDVDFALA